MLRSLPWHLSPASPPGSPTPASFPNRKAEPHLQPPATSTPGEVISHQRSRGPPAGGACCPHSTSRRNDTGKVPRALLVPSAFNLAARALPGLPGTCTLLPGSFRLPRAAEPVCQLHPAFRGGGGGGDASFESRLHFNSSCATPLNSPRAHHERATSHRPNPFPCGFFAKRSSPPSSAAPAAPFRSPSPSGRAELTGRRPTQLPRCLGVNLQIFVRPPSTPLVLYSNEGFSDLEPVISDRVSACSALIHCSFTCDLISPSLPQSPSLTEL